MKREPIIFLLGIFVAISFAATISDLTTVKPAVPKITIVKSIDIRDSEKYIKKYIKQGYIIKSADIAYGNGIGACLLIMEKY